MTQDEVRKAIVVTVEPTPENIAALEEDVARMQLVLERNLRYIASLEAGDAKLGAMLDAQKAVAKLATEYVWLLDAGYDVLASDALDQLKAAVFALDKKEEASDEPPLRLPPMPNEVEASAETIAELRAKLEQAHAAAAVMRKALEAVEYPVDTPVMTGDDRLVPEFCCAICHIVKGEAHRAGCIVSRALVLSSTGEAHHLLDVVARARELEEVLMHEQLSGRAVPQKLYGAHFNLIGALAVLDDKGKKEKAGG